jgi:nucleoside 2-deoxyribosyltransferase
MQYKQSVYLAGGIHGLSFEEANGWRSRMRFALQSCNIGVINPMRGNDWMNNKRNSECIGKPPKTCNRPWLTSAQAILNRDLSDIDRCDAVIMNLTKNDAPKVGTLVELGYAYANKKPIIIFTDDERLDWHPFIKGMATMVVPNIETAIQEIESLLSGVF